MKQIITSENRIFLSHCQRLIVIHPRAKLSQVRRVLILSPVCENLEVSLPWLPSVSWSPPSRACGVHVPLSDALAAFANHSSWFWRNWKGLRGGCESHVKDGLCPPWKEQNGSVRNGGPCMFIQLHMAARCSGECQCERRRPPFFLCLDTPVWEYMLHRVQTFYKIWSTERNKILYGCVSK